MAILLVATRLELEAATQGRSQRRRPNGALQNSDGT